MPRKFIPTGIHITGGVAHCAYHCRYCQLASIRPAHYGIDRFVGMVEKFRDYRKSLGNKDFEVSQWLGYTYDQSIEDFTKHMKLYHESGWDANLVLTGGVRQMPDDELRKWLIERRPLNIKKVVTSFCGYGEQHDWWNNKPGNFEYQLNMQKIAMELGFKNIQRTFLLQSTLPVMEKLLDRFDEVKDSVVERDAYPLFYSGIARHYERDRVTFEMLDKQPQRVREMYRKDIGRWKSEKDWIVKAKETENDDEKGCVSLILTDQNIDKYEKMPCEEIISELTERTQMAYNAVPGRAELCEKYSDSTSEKIYMFMWDMECLWVDRYLKEHPAKFERALTVFGR